MMRGRVGSVLFLEVYVGPNATASAFAPMGFDVVVQATAYDDAGVFLAVKRKHLTTGQRTQLFQQRSRRFPVGAKQRIWIRNENQDGAYVYFEVWRQTAEGG